MTNYRIEMMTGDDYGNYMMGYNDYNLNVEYIEANTKEEAVEIAKRNYPTMVINENYVKSIEEMKAEAEAEKKAHERFLKAEAEKKARKEAREKEKAEAMGMTLAEYKEYKKAEAKKKRYANEIKKMEAEIERLKEEIAWRKKYL